MLYLKKDLNFLYPILNSTYNNFNKNVNKNLNKK